MKTAVCLVIILLSIVIGSSLRKEIKRRCESLDALRGICIKLGNEISFRAPPLNELMEKCSERGQCASLFDMDMDNGFASAWRENARKWSKAMGLTQAEEETVQMLSSLGSADIEGEKRLLEEVSKRLSEHSAAAHNELATRGKMLFSCSVLAGLALVIFII